MSAHQAFAFMVTICLFGLVVVSVLVTPGIAERGRQRSPPKLQKLKYFSSIGSLSIAGDTARTRERLEGVRPNSLSSCASPRF